MHLHHETVEMQVQSRLHQLGQQRAVAAYVAGVAEQRHVGQQPFEFDGHFPQRVVPIAHIVVGEETAVHGGDIGDVGLLHPLQSPQPEVDVGRQRVLDHDGQGCAVEGATDFAYRKRVARGAAANPHGVDTVA